MKKILIVEDDVAQTKALAQKFSGKGYEVLQAKDGESGLRTALEEYPDCILLDLIMPVMDGMTMLQKLREDEWGKSANVILLTNLSSQEQVIQAMDLNSHEYLVKTDWKLEDVVKKVDQLING